MDNRGRFSRVGKRMRDVARASGYVVDIGGGPGRKGTAIIDFAFEFLTKMFPHKEEPDEQWTHRRVRSFFKKEAALVRFGEMVELHYAAERAKEERALIERARREHAEFIAKTASLRALLERVDQDFHGDQIENLGGVLGGMDRAGDCGK